MWASPTGNGALYTLDNNKAQGGSTTAAANQGLGFDASRSSSIYGNSDTVQPPALCVNICIKF